MRTIGIHLILVAVGSIPKMAYAGLKETFAATADKHQCQLRESCIREDHVHLLLAADDEGAVAEFIAGAMEKGVELIKTYSPDFDFSDKVHVTLLPPWHLEILASFLRDQDRYHKTRTLQEEIDEIFRPNAVEVSPMDVVLDALEKQAN